MNQPSSIDLLAVVGASGAQGGAITRECLRRDLPVRGLSRGTGNVPDGATHIRADLGSADELGQALYGVSHLVVTVPLCYEQRTVEEWMRNLATAARAAGVRHVVMNTNTRLPESSSAASFETRRVAERILSESGAAVSVLRPTVYLENLLAPPVVAGIVREGVLRYPVPEDTLVGWMSHGCLAEAVAAALLGGASDGEVIEIGGRDLLGSELAEHFSTVLSKPVRYEALPPETFEEGLVHALGADAASGVAGLYHWMGERPTTDLMTGGTEGLKSLGVHAEPTPDWIARQSWRT